MSVFGRWMRLKMRAPGRICFISSKVDPYDYEPVEPDDELDVSV